MLTFVGFDEGSEEIVPEEEPISKNTPEWEAFEIHVAEALKEFGDSKVKQNVMVTGELSEIKRQVDVLCTGNLGGAPHMVAVECKRYKRPINVGAIDQFVGMLHDIAADSGILYRFSGASAAAKKRAANARLPKIVLRDVNDLIPWQPGLPELMDEDYCQIDGCYGEVSWHDVPVTNETDDPDVGETMELGLCSSCGGYSIRCAKCEEDIYEFDGDQGRCYDCHLAMGLVTDRDRVAVEVAVVTSSLETEAAEELAAEQRQEKRPAAQAVIT